MSSLQALLDSQELRRGASIVGGGVGGNDGGREERGDYRPIYNRNRPLSSTSSRSASHSSATNHRNRTIADRQSWHHHPRSEGWRGGNNGGSNNIDIGVDDFKSRRWYQFQQQKWLSPQEQPPAPSPPFSTRWRREREDVVAAAAAATSTKVVVGHAWNHFDSVDNSTARKIGERRQERRRRQQHQHQLTTSVVPIWNNVLSTIVALQ